MTSRTVLTGPSEVTSRVQLFATMWTAAYHTPPCMGFSRQECWSGCHCLLQRIFPTQGSNPGLPHCRQMLYCLSHQSVFIFASFPFYASKNQLTISFPLYFCGTILPWLSSYTFGHFSLVSVLRLIFLSFSLNVSYPGFHLLFFLFFFFFFFLFLFHVLSLLVVSNTAIAVQNQTYSYKNKVNYVTIKNLMDLKLNTLSFWVVLHLWYSLVVILMSYALIID